MSEREVAEVPRYIFQVYHFAETLKLKAIEPLMGMPAITRSANKLVYQEEEGSFFFLYRFGSLVFFNVEPARQTAIMEKLKLITGRSDFLVTSDEYALETQKDSPNSVQFERVIVDKLTLDRVEIMALILAQSTTLEYFEIKVDELVGKSGEIGDLLKRTGRLWLRSTKINRFIGNCMATKQELVTSLYLLDKPDETWQDQILDSLYRDAVDMFELKERYKTIDYKLKMVQENLELIGDLLAGRKNTFLEFLIVVLIAVEIVLFVYDLWLK